MDKKDGHWLENRVLTKGRDQELCCGQPVDVEDGIELRLKVVGEWVKME